MKSLKNMSGKKQYRVDIIKNLIRDSVVQKCLYDETDDSFDEKELSRLVKAILVETDKI
jgi:hypothetical protein